MDIRPIRSAADYARELKRIDELMDSAAGTSAGDELDILATLVEAYEDRHFPIDSPDPVSAIRFRMEQMEIGVKDLEPFIGSRNRVWEVLNNKRGLSISMIRRLHKGLNIPLENLIKAD
ncbi:MAG: transcriptional regulator [Proteobacteria bacterium]|nr:transcriptional regulator [Pseudomonadota bacterium]